jgi:hypothetical protein
MDIEDTLNPLSDVATRRLGTHTCKLLVSELETSDGYKLVLSQPVFIEIGQRYWAEESVLVIEGGRGSRTTVPGSWETVCR